MKSVIVAADLPRALARITGRLIASEAELNALDAALGDGDCGTTVARLARAVAAEIQALPGDLGEALAQLARVIGGISGSSFSGVAMIGLTQAGYMLKGRGEINPAGLAIVLQASIQAMSDRSGARLGDKSLLDALAAVADSLAEPRIDDEPLSQRADRAVGKALDAFRSLPCRIGRARLAGPRSIGRDDPGMVVLKRAMEALTTVEPELTE